MSLTIAERRDQVRCRTRMGESASQIADALGITVRTVTRHRASLGIAQPRPAKLTTEQHRIAAILANDGCSATEIARTVGCSYQSILRYYPHAKWTPRMVAEHAATIRHSQRKATA